MKILKTTLNYRKSHKRQIIAKNMLMQQEKIVKMFDEIAPSYDLVNRIVSFGSDKSWREKAIKETLKYIKNPKVLDVACGSGDMIEIWKKYIHKITGLDASKGMLEIAKKRFPEIKFYQGLAQNLPFEDESFDCLSISFGIRNVVEIDKAINEFKRVLKKDGILLILEFTKPTKQTSLRNAIDFYSNKILPKIGGIISKNKEAYEYLPSSIQNFYTLDELSYKLKGFEIKTAKNFTLSPASMIMAKKI